ncbi:hypothetical protein CCAL13119_03860 [Campylobacter sp. RM13119]|nr:hypothetical protein [Campylobacter sp. RM13119]MBE3606098.1 hypothetical protein [Campylobacter sp. RM13119]
MSKAMRSRSIARLRQGDFEFLSGATALVVSIKNLKSTTYKPARQAGV